MLQTVSQYQFIVFKACLAVYVWTYALNTWLWLDIQCTRGKLHDQCLSCTREPCERTVGPTQPTLLEQGLVASALIACMLLPVSAGLTRQAAAVLMCVFWFIVNGTWIGATITHPAMAYVSWALVAAACTPTFSGELFWTKKTRGPKNDANFKLDMHTGRPPEWTLFAFDMALISGYLPNVFGKLMTPQWQQGAVFAVLGEHEFRSFPPQVLVLVRWMSPLLSFGAMALELGATGLMATSHVLLALKASHGCSISLPPHVPKFPHTPRCLEAKTLRETAIALSLTMHLGVLVLMPLTDVSVGMLVFHLGQMDAEWWWCQLCRSHLVAAASNMAHHEPGADRASKPTGASARRHSADVVVKTAMAVAFLAYPVTCAAYNVACAVAGTDSQASRASHAVSLSLHQNHWGVPLKNLIMPVCPSGYERYPCPLKTWSLDSVGHIPFALQNNVPWDTALGVMDSKGVGHNLRLQRLKLAPGGHLWHALVDDIGRALFWHAGLAVQSSQQGNMIKIRAGAVESAAALLCGCSPLANHPLVQGFHVATRPAEFNMPSAARASSGAEGVNVTAFRIFGDKRLTVKCALTRTCGGPGGPAPHHRLY